MNFWQGKKVRLRAIEPSDWEVFARWDLDSERARNLSFLWPPQSKTQITAWATDLSGRKLENDAYFWVIESEEGDAVGSINTQECRPRDGTFSYGVAIAEEHRRKGYAREAIRLVLKYYFEEMRYQKVNVPVFSHNPASLGLHDSLGFTREGVRRRAVFSRGQYYDEVLFGMTAEEFAEKLAGPSERG